MGPHQVGLLSLGREDIKPRVQSKAATIHGGGHFKALALSASEPLVAALKVTALPQPPLDLTGPQTDRTEPTSDGQVQQHQQQQQRLQQQQRKPSSSCAGGLFHAIRHWRRKEHAPPYRCDDFSVKAGRAGRPYIVDDSGLPLETAELYRRGMIRFAAGPPSPPAANLLGKRRCWTVHGGNNFEQPRSARHRQPVAAA